MKKPPQRDEVHSGTATLTPGEAATELRISRSSVYRLIAAKQLPTVHVGPSGVTRITRKDLDSYIAKCRVERSA